jgi:hypothetical protein
MQGIPAAEDSVVAAMQVVSDELWRGVRKTLTNRVPASC